MPSLQSLSGQQLRNAILQNTLLPIESGQGPPGAPGPPGVPALALPHITVMVNYSANVNIPVILCNGTLTVTLPVATGSGSAFFIKNIGAGVVTVAGTNIDGAGTAVMRSQYEAIQLVDCAVNQWEVF